MAMNSDHPLLASNMTLKRSRVVGVPVEWIEPKTKSPQPVLLYLHGGGWALGLNNGYRWLASQICRASSTRALLVDYRLTPEYPFPTGLQDCLSVYRWLLQMEVPPRQIVIAGDSAGGNLTLARLLTLRDNGEFLPAAGICLSALTDLSCSGETYATLRDPLLPTQFIQDLIRLYVGNRDAHDQLLSPLYGDLRGLPPLLIQVGGNEILLSDSVRFAERARLADVAVTLEISEGMGHVWQVFTPLVPEAKQAVQSIGDFVQKHVETHKQHDTPS